MDLFLYARLLSLSFCSHGDTVKHYHIKQDENNFYKISARHCFPTIPELVEYHKLNCGGKYDRKFFSE